MHETRHSTPTSLTAAWQGDDDGRLTLTWSIASTAPTETPAETDLAA
jgi:hypothetical protein